MKLFDQHLHCNCSFDSKEPMENYIKFGLENGINNFLFTDHFDFTECFDTDFIKRNEISIALSKKYPQANIMQGIEIGYLKNKIKETEIILNSFPFQTIILSVHYVNGLDYYSPEELLKYSLDESLILYFDTLREAILNTEKFDILGHFDYAFKTAKKIDNSLKISKFEKYLIPVFKALIIKDKCLEINVKVQNSINDERHLDYVLSLYRSVGGSKISFGSDAHNLSDYMNHFAYYCDIFKRNGFDELTYYIDHIAYKYKI